MITGKCPVCGKMAEISIYPKEKNPSQKETQGFATHERKVNKYVPMFCDVKGCHLSEKDLIKGGYLEEKTEQVLQVGQCPKKNSKSNASVRSCELLKKGGMT